MSAESRHGVAQALVDKVDKALLPHDGFYYVSPADHEEARRSLAALLTLIDELSERLYAATAISDRDADRLAVIARDALDPTSREANVALTELARRAARLRMVEAERDAVLQYLLVFHNEDDQPTLDVLVRRCFAWGDEAWHVAGGETDARSAAEAERDEALAQLHYVPDDWRYTGRLRAAEVRCAALEAVAEAARRLVTMPGGYQFQNILDDLAAALVVVDGTQR